MKVTLLTLFPGLVDPYFRHSLMEKAIQRGIIDFSIVDIRDYATDKHRSCDDYPYGGGPGMVLRYEPLSAALAEVCDNGTASSEGQVTLLPSPAGIPLDQTVAQYLAAKSHLILIAGRYEGIDQRVIDEFIDYEISLGDFVMSSGELSCLVVVDTVARLLEGFINRVSLEKESFEGGLLEYPHYTRPEICAGGTVPEVLTNGHHERIEMWRAMKRVQKTAAIRPDILSTRNKQKNTARTLQLLRAGADRRGKK